MGHVCSILFHSLAYIPLEIHIVVNLKLLPILCECHFQKLAYIFSHLCHN